MMNKFFLLAGASLSLALAVSCATGGNAPPPPTVSIDDNGISVAGVTLSIPMTASVSPASTPSAVNWAITGASCSGSGNPCGTLSSATTSSVTFTAPSSVPSTPQINVTATLQANSSVVGTLSLTISDIATQVTPALATVGTNLTQQFTAVALPDNATQQFTWSCTVNGSAACANFAQDSKISGLAYYTGQDSCTGACVQITATPTMQPTSCSLSSSNCTPAKVTPETSRLQTGTYSYKFSGYDNSGNPVIAAGTFGVNNGAILPGVEDTVNASGFAKNSITGGSFTPSTTDPHNSNNSGTLVLTGASPTEFQIVLNVAGDIQMIETDGQGSGWGVVERVSAGKVFNSGAQAYAFGLTGVDASGARAGFAGLIPINGSGNVSGGLMDVNDNGNTSNICGSSPCNVSGTYTADATTAGLWHFVLTSAVTQHFDMFVANGGSTSNAPLNLYVVATDPVDSTHPAVLGTMTLQDSTKTYNNAAFNGTSVSVLTGAGSNVSLTLGNTDGNGDFSGQFDQNNGGTELSVSSFAYKYAAAPASGGSNVGRYTFQMLGNPGASPAVSPVNFVLYASGANVGYLLDQSSTSVITGIMTPQTGPKQNGGIFANSSLTGTFAAATNSSSASSVTPQAMNLLLTSQGNSTFDVNGTEYPPGAAGNVSGSYSITANGTGTIGLTAPGTADYILYAVDGTDFYLIIDASKDKGVTSPVVYVSQ
jgi:hypothetical protein